MYNYRLAVSREAWCCGVVLIRGKWARFHDIAWTNRDSAKSRGIIAGALENGSLDLWDADKLLNDNG